MDLGLKLINFLVAFLSAKNSFTKEEELLVLLSTIYAMDSTGAVIVPLYKHTVHQDLALNMYRTKNYLIKVVIPFLKILLPR